jgi:hypothetical protein
MWPRFAWGLLGTACFIASAFVPAAAPYLLPAGAGFVGLALPATQLGLVRPSSPADPK